MGVSRLANKASCRLNKGDLGLFQGLRFVVGV